MAEAYQVGVMVAWRAFHGGSEVEDDFVRGCRFTPSFEHPIAQLDSKFGLGLGERLEAIVEGEFSA